MSKVKIDTTNCDKEPIHFIGKIQSHGFLIGVNRKSYLITYISENIIDLIGINANTFLNKPLDKLSATVKIKEYKQGSTFSQWLFHETSNGFEKINPFYVELSDTPWHMIITNAGENILLEFEPCKPEINFDLQKAIGQSISKILAEPTLNSLLHVAAGQVKTIIGYDRVMIYKFNEEGHGEVVAEEKNDDLEPFLGLHYPGSDIPRQARELYKINLTRIIADVNAECPAIVASLDNKDPLDLTNSVLRAVSPIHIQYLKNMGVEASFSISLLSHGELWGLVACHNYSPRFIDYRARETAKLISQIISPAIEYRLGEEDIERFNLLNQSVNNLIHLTESDDDIVRVLTSNKITIREICNCSGAAILFDNSVTCVGETPGHMEIKRISRWLFENTNELVFHTNQFPLLYPEAEKYSALASGLFACILSREFSEVVLFFKPERKQKIDWAGNPEKSVTLATDGSMQLIPRRSFAKWTEIVKYSSENWDRAEIAALINFRDQLMYQLNRKARAIRILNDRLKLAHEELDAFSSTVSHDLKAPLTSIKSYAQLLLENNNSLDENARYVLKRIDTCTDKMALLIKEILNYSSFSCNKIKPVKINMQRVIESCKSDLFGSYKPENLELVIGNTPDIIGDEVMIGQVFSNLLGNAIKYSSKKIKAIVKIEGRNAENVTTYSISDNGIGIEMQDHTRMFDLFKRLDNARDFDGTGVGLAIVKRIVEKHGGRIWFDSELDKGTVFYVSFKKDPETSEGDIFLRS